MKKILYLLFAVLTFTSCICIEQHKNPPYESSELCVELYVDTNEWEWNDVRGCWYHIFRIPQMSAYMYDRSISNMYRVYDDGIQSKHLPYIDGDRIFDYTLVAPQIVEVEISPVGAVITRPENMRFCFKMK